MDPATFPVQRVFAPGTDTLPGLPIQPFEQDISDPMGNSMTAPGIPEAISAGRLPSLDFATVNIHLTPEYR